MSTPKTPPTPNNMPLSYYEELAASQRRNIHNSVTRLRTAAKQNIRERLDVNRNLRRYFWPAAGIASLAGLILGYGMSGMVVDR